MRVAFLILIVVVLFLVCGVLLLLARNQAKKHRMQFSLRGFLIVVALIAIGIASIQAYRVRGMARVEWIDPASTKAMSLFPGESVTVDESGAHFTYYTKRRSIQQMIGPINNVGNMSFRIDRQAITATLGDEETASAQLAELQKLDTLTPGVFVIRGKVVDRHGGPMAQAIVDVMGSYFFINHFITRDDGTFTMILSDGGTAPPGSGYYLCVRAKEETAEKHVRWNTSYFTLTPTSPEMVVQITVPYN